MSNLSKRALQFQSTGASSAVLYQLLVELAENIDRLNTVVNEQIVATTAKQHATAPETLVVSPSPVDLAGCIALVNEMKTVYNAHIADAAVHDAADATNGASSAAATNLATAITLANEIKADLIAHGTQANVHFANHTVTVLASDASDLDTLITLLIELKADLNDHLAESRSKGIRSANRTVTLG